jgi:hypothetical protein
VQADDLVIGLQRQGVELLGETRGGPLLEASADRSVRAAWAGEALVAGAVHERGHDVVEHDPIGDASAVAAEGMVGVEDRLLGQQNAELVPDGFEQARWHDTHGPSWGA